MNIYLLCEWDENQYARFEVKGWSSDRTALTARMDKLESEHHAEQLRQAVGKPWRVLPLNETSHRHYFIQEVEQIPLADLDNKG